MSKYSKKGYAKKKSYRKRAKGMSSMLYKSPPLKPVYDGIYYAKCGYNATLLYPAQFVGPPASVAGATDIIFTWGASSVGSAIGPNNCTEFAALAQLFTEWKIIGISMNLALPS